MSTENFPRLLERNVSKAFLLVFSFIFWPLNFHNTTVSRAFTLRPRHVKVALEPLLVTTLRWTGLSTGIVAVAPVKMRSEADVQKKNQLSWSTLASRRHDLMVIALDSGSNGPGSSLSWGLCVVFFRDTLLSQCFSPPRCVNGYWRIVGATRQNAGE